MNKPLILQLDSSGNPHKWITYEKAAYYYCKDMVAWEAGENEITISGGISRITGTRSLLSMNSIIAVRGKVKVNVRPPTLDNKVLFHRDKGICAYCGHKYHHSILTRDHIIPKVKNGKNIWSNCITSCKPCNNYKGEHTLDHLGISLRYPPYVPNRAEYLLHSNSKSIIDQTHFLLQLCPESSRVHEYITERTANE